MAEKKREDSQEKFSKENLDSLKNIQKSLNIKLKEFKVLHDTYINYRTKNDDEKAEEAYRELEEFAEDMSTEFVVIAIKLSNAAGHALNAQSTKPIRDVLEWMDEAGISDKAIHANMAQLASKRFRADGLLASALVVAAKFGDIKLVEYITEFSEKAKNRKNIFDIIGLKYDFKEYGNFWNMQSFRGRDNAAFEALVNGYEEVYRLIMNGGGVSEAMVQNYLKPQFTANKLKPAEIQNLISIEPIYIEFLLDNSPEDIPQNIKDIFIF